MTQGREMCMCEGGAQSSVGHPVIEEMHSGIPWVSPALLELGFQEELL